MSRWTWKNLTAGLAQLSLTGAGAIVVQSEGRRTRLLDRAGGVRFVVDRWNHEDVEVTPGPAVAADLDPADEELAQVFNEWAAGSRCVRGAALLSALPAGEYLLVRSRWLPTPAGLVPLGDGWVERGVDHELLTDDADTQAVVVSAIQNEPPTFGAPLLGLLTAHSTVLRRDGAPIFLAGLGGDRDDRDSGDLVLILPCSGPLVLDPPDPDAGPEYLTERFALAKRLATPLPGTRLPTLSWKPRSTHVGTLAVHRSRPDGIRCRHGPTWLELGTPTHRAPVLTLTRARGANATWRLDRAARPLLLGEGPEPDPDVAIEILEWAEGTSLTHGLSTLAALPAGHYLLIRVPAGACARDGQELRLRGHADARVVGPTAGLLDVSQPLVGFVFAPGSTHSKIVFTPLVVPIASDAAATADLVLVLPLAGELVTHADSTAANRWRDEDGPAFAALLGGAAATP